MREDEEDVVKTLHSNSNASSSSLSKHHIHSSLTISFSIFLHICDYHNHEYS
jgi:hypothetical protein